MTYTPPDLEGIMQDEFASTPKGLVRCLQALADEAACLNMKRTTTALHEAIAICQRESATMRAEATKQLPADMLH